jgi:hypothetical protein
VNGVALFTLRIEPHRIPPNTQSEHYAPPEGAVFYRVWVDGEALTDRATPFRSHFSMLELQGNVRYPFWADGSDYVSVRRWGEYVLWLPVLEDSDEYVNSGLPENRMLVFGGLHYVQVVDSIRTDIDNSRLPHRERKDTEHTLPLLSRDELRQILMRQFPNPEVTLYRVPESPLDTVGGSILRRTRRSIEMLSTTLYLASPPDTWAEVRIGLDMPEFDEAVWYIGRTDTGLAARFLKHPAFPLWLQGSAIDQAFAGEPFLKDLP